MPFSHTLAGTTFTEASFEGTAYANEQTGFPKALEKIVEHVAQAYYSPSTTSLTVGAGPQSLATEPNHPFAVGQPVRIASQAAPTTVFMDGSITAYDASTGAMTVEVVSVRGGGTTASDWMVSVGGVTQNTVTASPVPVSDGGTGASDAAGARLNLGLGALATAGVAPIASGGTGATSAAEARTNLELGDAAQDDVVPVAHGGTGSTTASAARSALGLGNDPEGRANLGLGNVATDDVVPLGRGGTGATTQAAARTALGLGSLATISSPLPLANGGTGSTTQAGARSNLGLGAVATDNTVPVSRGGTGSTTASAARSALGLGSVSTDNVVPVVRGGTGATTVSSARSALGLGSIATVNSPVPIANGGTGATTAEAALSNLGLSEGPTQARTNTLTQFDSYFRDIVPLTNGSGWLQGINWMVEMQDSTSATATLRIFIDGGAGQDLVYQVRDFGAAVYTSYSQEYRRYTSGFIPLGLRFKTSLRVQWSRTGGSAPNDSACTVSWVLE